MSKINGFSKLSKDEKIEWLIKERNLNKKEVIQLLDTFKSADKEAQVNLEKLSENTLGNFALPFSIAPNFIVDGQYYSIPMVIEESSVVGAASYSAKFWSKRGGFRTEIISTNKIGHVHFYWDGTKEQLKQSFSENKTELINSTSDITINMKNRGGGIKELELIDQTHLEPYYYQLEVIFETCDAMGANFINTVLERLGSVWKNLVEAAPAFDRPEGDLEIIMCILSNYNPDCLVKCWVECPVEELGEFSNNISAQKFASRFKKAVRIAEISTHRAVTHNKGILNGIDALILATGNDFRAIEACLHAYAARSGTYKSLSRCHIENGIFRFSVELPLAVGTVGGITSIHPLSKLALKILGNPDARTLMSIMAATGLAQNFAALRALITTGIQKGHMKMHLMNILNQLDATKTEIPLIENHFKDKVISFRQVADYLTQLRCQEKQEHHKALH